MGDDNIFLSKPGVKDQIAEMTFNGAGVRDT
ncbi:IS1-like element transposase, partial [Escherichia sp. SS-MK2]